MTARTRAMRCRRLCAMGAVALLAGGCATLEVAAPPITESLTNAAIAAGSSEVEIRSGREVFLAYCTGCHRPPVIRQYTAQQWDDIMPRMARKAKLSAAKEREMATYVTAVLHQPAEPEVSRAAPP